jgi:hypothetical protein
MAQSQADVQAKLDQLSSTIDAERQEVLDALKALKDQIANGGDLTALGDSVDALIAKTQGIITDADK